MKLMNGHSSGQAFSKSIVIHTTKSCRYPLLAWAGSQNAAAMAGIFHVVRAYADSL